MTKITSGERVTLAQAASLILASPNVRYLLQGPPGIGKSSIMAELKRQLPTHAVSYMDVPNLDLGDICMPVVNREEKVTNYYPNARFQMHTGKPVIIMLDEFTKGATPVINMLHPLLEASNPRLGDLPVHPDSIVFMTGNLASDGVGDMLKAHTKNRIVPLDIQPPSADEWIKWGINNNIDPVVLAWVNQFPHALEFYKDAQDKDGNVTNPYIFNPKKMQSGFVSPRSLETASKIISKREKFDSDALICALIGAIGNSAARDIQAYIEFQDQLPSWDSILAAPSKAKVPTSVGAKSVLIFGAVTKATKETYDQIIEYIERFDTEWQAVFMMQVANGPAAKDLFGNKHFQKWAVTNQKYL